MWMAPKLSIDSYENDFNNSKVVKNDTKPNERNFFNVIEATRVHVEL